MGNPSEAAQVRPFPGKAHTTARDRVPPQNLDAEASVLGSMLLSKNAIADISEIVRAEDFYRGAHRTIFEAIRGLYDRGEPVDAVTLVDELDGRGLLADVGGAPAVADLVSRVPTAANAVYYGKIVADHALRRRLIDAGGEIARIGFENSEDATAAVDAAESLMYEVGQRGIRSEFVAMKDLLTASFAQIERLSENSSAITGLETGFHDFDELTAGLQPSNLVIVAARPAMGKCLGGGEEVLDPGTGALHRIDELVAAGAGGRVAALGADQRLRPARVSAVHTNGVQPVFALRTSLGRRVVATANHPFLTPQGWVELRDLRPGARLATPRALPYFGTDDMADAEVVRLARSTVDAVDGAVFRLPRQQVALFLSHLYAQAGTPLEGPPAQVGYASSSETVARQVQHLLLRFGILAVVAEGGRPGPAARTAWQVQVRDQESLRRLVREVGTAGPGATLPGRELVSAASGRARQPGVRPPSPQLLAEIAAYLDDPELSALAASDVYWDEVVDVEPAGEEQVYDLTVPGDHNFVASDVIVHNSTLVTNVATHVAVELRQPVVMFSLEMSKIELVHRILAAESRVDSERLRTGRLQDNDWPKLSQAMGKLAEAQLFIDDTPGINLMEIRSKCRRLKQRHGLALVIVDYLQLMQSHRRVENRVQEVSELSRGLKILAKELDLPVMALSQLSRRPEERTDRRPQLSDLRESGCVTGDTLVSMASGAVLPIDALVGTQPEVVTLDGWSRATGRAEKVWQTGCKPVLRLVTGTGRVVRATANHPLRKLEGWSPLGALEVGDRIAIPGRHRDGRHDDDRTPELISSGAAARFGLAPSTGTLSQHAVALAGAGLQELPATDVYWDTVVSIEPDGVEDVYDMTVPGTHSFVGNGIYLHNSIEQDADLVAFIYRDEVYNPDTDAKGEAELIVAKHRNGPLRSVRLSFIGHHSRFASMARGPMRGGSGAPL